jgi:hypothetical protein
LSSRRCSLFLMSLKGPPLMTHLQTNFTHFRRPVNEALKSLTSEAFLVVWDDLKLYGAFVFKVWQRHQ